jgi:hypothetical protein
MFGLSIISTGELKSLRALDESFGKELTLNYHLQRRVASLEKEVEKLTPKRGERGKFVKKYIKQMI